PYWSEVDRGRGPDTGECRRCDESPQALGSGCGFGSGNEAGEQRSGEGAGVCESGARRGSEGGLRMATVPRTAGVKIPTSRAKTAREMGHPASSQKNGGGRFGVYGGR